MPSNDVILLNSILQKNKPLYGTRDAESEYFELFSIDNVLKNFELSLDELEDGWVDDSDDGGIDGFYVFVDGIFLSDQFETKHVRQEPHIEVYILTVKSANTFKQAPVVSLITSLGELFNFQLDTMENSYPAQLLEVRERFRSTYIDLASKNPRLSVRVLYCSRGDSARLAKNIQSKLNQLRKNITAFFSRVTTDAQALGATELLHLAQRTKKYSLLLPFTETYISRDGANYVILCRLKDYINFITDENGDLRRYLFDGNVRDYLGDVQVNSDIASSLLEAGGVDFWWLNNGVTILASGATVAGKALSIDNVLVVNGLQTTETLYRTLTERIRPDDERAILIKIIISSDDDVRARIIKATNYQNTVDLASLRSLDQLQRNIEAYLFDHGWFYERRSNFYRNQRKPGDRILSIRQLGTAVRALAFRTPRTAERRQKWLRHDNSYRQVFNPAWPLCLYLGCAVVSRSVEWSSKKRSGVWQGTKISGMARQWSSFIALLITCIRLQDTEYEPQRLGELADAMISQDEIRAATGHIVATLQRSGKYPRYALGAEDERAILKELKANGFAPLVPAPLDFPPEPSNKTRRHEAREAKKQEKMLARLASRASEAAQPGAATSAPDSPEHPQSHKLPRKA